MQRFEWIPSINASNDAVLVFWSADYSLQYFVIFIWCHCPWACLWRPRKERHDGLMPSDDECKKKLAFHLLVLACRGVVLPPVVLVWKGGETHIRATMWVTKCDNATRRQRGDTRETKRTSHDGAVIWLTHGNSLLARMKRIAMVFEQGA